MPLRVTMKISIAMLALVAAVACQGGRAAERTSTTTDTNVTPTHATDTTVVKKQVDVKTDTVKKTDHKP